MPSVYERWGVKFLYPENWRTIEESDDEWPKTITVQSPGSAFLTLHVYEGSVNLSTLLSEAVEAMAELYSDLEATEVEECTDGADRGFDLDFYCLDLLVSAQLRGYIGTGRAYVWLAQAEDRDFEECAGVFRAIVMQILGKVPTPPE